jgi:hypothetical protein
MILTLQQLTLDLGLPPNAWDLLLVGDGSGVGWERPAGWSVLYIDRQGGDRHLFAGGVSSGTIAWAELEPYLHCLRYDLYKRNNGKLKDIRKVSILTDSQTTARIGNGEFRANVNGDLWASLDYFRAVGYQVTFHWKDRNQMPATVLVDRLSRTGEIYSEMIDGQDPFDVLVG